MAQALPPRLFLIPRCGRACNFVCFCSVFVFWCVLFSRGSPVRKTLQSAFKHTPSYIRLGLQRAIRLGSKELFAWAPKSYSLGLQRAIRLGSKELFAWAPKSYSLGLQRAIRLGSKELFAWAPKSYSLGLQRAIRLGSKELFAWAPKSYSLGLQRAIRLGSKELFAWAPKSYSLGLQRAIRLGSKELFAWAPKSYSLGLQRVNSDIIRPPGSKQSKARDGQESGSPGPSRFCSSLQGAKDRFLIKSAIAVQRDGFWRSFGPIIDSSAVSGNS